MSAARSVATAAPPMSRLPELFEDARLRLQTTFSATSIGSMTSEELERIEITKGIRFGDEVVILPAEWFPAGYSQTLSHRSWRWASIATDRHPVGSPGYTAARLSVLRALVALWVLPQRSERHHKTKVLKPGTYVGSRAKPLLYLAREVLSAEDTSPTSEKVFSGLTKTQALRAIEASRKAYPATALSLIAGMDYLRAKGTIQDWLPEAEGFQATPRPAENSRPVPERARKGDAPPTSDPDEDNTWQPLPDAFVGELGWRALWLIEDLGPGLIDCLERLESEKLLESQEKHETLSATGVKTARLKVIRNQLQKVARRARVEEFPFSLRFTRIRKRSVDLAAWPPPSYEVLQQLVTILQTCHIFVVSLSMGARWSEIASLTRGCLLPDEVTAEGIDRVDGRTYKLIDGIGGGARDWPLHPTAVAAIRQQVRLAEILAPNVDCLWVSEGRDGLNAWGALKNGSRPLGRLAWVTGTEALLGETSFHSHRFRKTIARLAALALVGAPKILMDLFGHRSIEMTLRYVLSDPGIAAEIEEAAKGMVIMLGEEAIRTADGNGGPAAEGLRAHLRERLARTGADNFGSDQLLEVAEILTANGKAVSLVRPGVLCTKLPRQAGPCTRRVGHPDPSRCKVDCDHRLDLAAARQDAEKAIERCIAFLRDPEAQDNEMLMSWLLGQIKAHMDRFKDLAARYAAHPELAGLLDEGKAASA